MKRITIILFVFLCAIIKALGQNLPPTCQRVPPFNNPIFTFNQKVLKFNGGIGSNGFSIENRTSFPTLGGANGIYDIDGNLLFYVTLKVSDIDPSRRIVVAYTSDGIEHLVNQWGPLDAFASGSIELPIFPVPGLCGEYIILYPGGGSPLIDGGCDGNLSKAVVLSHIRFNSSTQKIETIYSKPILGYCGNFPKFAVSSLRKTSNNPGPYPEKFYREIYIAGQFGQQNPILEPEHRQVILAHATIFEVGTNSGYPDEVEVARNYIPIYKTGLPNDIGYPQIDISSNDNTHVQQLKFLSQNPDKLLVATTKRPLFYNIGSQTVCDNPVGSPLHLLEQEVVNNQYRYTLKSVQSDLTEVNGVEMLDFNPFDNVINYLFFSAPGISSANTIGIEKDYPLSNFCASYVPNTNDKLPTIRASNFRGIVNPATNQGHNSTLQLSVGYKYLVYGRAEGKIGLLDIGQSSFFNAQFLTTYASNNHHIADLAPFENNGKYATNFQLYREGYGQTNSSMLPSCVPDYSFSNTSTLSGNPKIPANSRAQNFIEAMENTSVESNTSADFRAGQKVHLKAGFHAKPNSRFYAVAQPCTYQTNCCLAFEDNTPIPLLGGGASGGSSGNGFDFYHAKSKHVVFPNPAKNQFQLGGFETDNIAKVSLINIHGKQLAYWDGNETGVYPLTNLAQGLYYIVVETKNAQTTALPLLVE